MQSPGQIFRALHETDGAFIIPNPWDIGSARILADKGFKALATTSAGLAFSLGVPEGQVTRQVALAHCTDIVTATPLPVSADLEKGFEDTPEGVADTITMAAATGLAGCSIEDHTGNLEAPIFEFELAVERVAAAVQASRKLSEDFVLTARCENLLWDQPGLDDVIKRLKAYEAAGADVLYAPGLFDLDLIREVCASVSKPVNVVMGLPGTTFGVSELADAGVKRISVGAALFRLAYGALIGAADEMAGQGSFSFAADAVGFAELETIFKSAVEQ